MKRSYGGTHLDTAQKQLSLLGRLDGPSVVPTHYIEGVASYRQAVRLCWALRRVHYMTREQAAAEAGLYAKHVSDYLAEDDKPGRRSLPAERVAAFEAVCGNSAISQWIASRSNLTVLEQMQADRRAA